MLKTYTKYYSWYQPFGSAFASHIITRQSEMADLARRATRGFIAISYGGSELRHRSILENYNA